MKNDEDLMGCTNNVWDRLLDLLGKYDGDFKVDIHSQSAWGGQLRLTIEDMPGKPAFSIAFYKGGGIDPEDVATQLIDEAEKWIAEAKIKPLSTTEMVKRYHPPTSKEDV